ncbi:putative potassium transporter 13 [Camellia lanceoleosa]|uniref:Potassium transporter 13 n=1 Tax=Camellia lanceoleosa TaxID=1840588 RepID=A0ACC0H649_9ERIC|nr:putative potassium transporter 13 [Camellia lanceoleosa]
MPSESPPPNRLKLYQRTLCLAYQSFGIVYGDLSTSPIYVYKSTFSGSLSPYKEDHEILGVLSLVFWTLTLIPLCKYILIVLAADDNGEGGTFALYSLLCRHLKAGLLSTSHGALHRVTSSDNAGTSVKETKTSLLIKDFFEKHHSSRVVLLLVVLLGTSMVIGDGILTPTMSVLSAVNGLRIKITVTDLHGYYTSLIACVILVGIFALQHYGTHRVGFLFAPILISWLICISGIGIYNIIYWNPQVVYAMSPYYAYNFFKQAGKDGWRSLGGVVLCITGAEAMFADLGHFSQLSLRITFIVVVYPCLVLAYMGEAAYLTKNKMELQSSFYKAIPERIFWPVFIIATLATAVGSQAIISATFSIISQCRALRCFPRVKIIHTSGQVHGQIYIPEVNWTLMVLCLAVVIGFRDTDRIGNAYGLAVITVMFVTTCLMFLIISTVWNRNVLLATTFLVVFGSIELLYLSACLCKVHKGGWLPLLFSLVILALMSAWQYGTSKKQAFELKNKASMERLLSHGPSLGMVRVRGIALIYSSLAATVPPMFAHWVTNFSALHQILIFVTLENYMVPNVPLSDRIHVGRIGPQDSRVFWCIVRYGFKDPRDSYNLETQLIGKVEEFLRSDSHDEEPAINGYPSFPVLHDEAGVGVGRRRNAGSTSLQLNEELQELIEAREAGVVYMLGNTYIVASEVSPVMKKFAINIVYAFLRRNSRRPAVALGIPHPSLIEMGMAYHV